MRESALFCMSSFFKTPYTATIGDGNNINDWASIERISFSELILRKGSGLDWNGVWNKRTITEIMSINTNKIAAAPVHRFGLFFSFWN
jgi:hypothetical protein